MLELKRLLTSSKFTTIRLLKHFLNLFLYFRSKSQIPNKTTVAHSAHMDIFQNLAVDSDNECRYLFLNAIANQLRYPNSHTHYFSCALLYLFGETNSVAIQVILNILKVF